MLQRNVKSFKAQDDEHIEDVAQQVAKLYKEEFGESITVDEIIAIVNAQFGVIRESIDEGEEIRLPFICSFQHHKDYRKKRKLVKGEVNIKPKKFQLSSIILNQ